MLATLRLLGPAVKDENHLNRGGSYDQALHWTPAELPYTIIVLANHCKKIKTTKAGSVTELNSCEGSVVSGIYDQALVWMPANEKQ